MGNRSVQIESLLAGLLDDNGNPLAAGKVYTYEAGTSTPKTTWTDAAKTTPSTNPIILDAVGRADVYADGEYKLVIKTSADVLVSTHDGVKYRNPSSNVLTKISNYTATYDDDVILANAASGGITITLPSAVNAIYPLVVKKIDATANVVTIAASGGQTIDGSATITISVQNGTATLYSDGAQWRGASQVVTAGDSDKVDGYHAGNSSGQVPVSNGTVNTNLNADFLDGEHGAFYRNASNMNAGTIPLAQVPATLTGKDADTLDTYHAADLIAITSPPGVVTAFAGSTPPSGWLECDGSAVSRSSYSALYAIIGTTYGNGDGSSTFNLPELRGEFIRGWSHTRTGVDEARSIGTSQPAETQMYKSVFNGANAAGTYSGGPFDGNEWNRSTDSAAYTMDRINQVWQTNLETRPRNIAMMYIIKF